MRDNELVWHCINRLSDALINYLGGKDEEGERNAKKQRTVPPHSTAPINIIPREYSDFRHAQYVKDNIVLPCLREMQSDGKILQNSFVSTSSGSYTVSYNSSTNEIIWKLSDHQQVRIIFSYDTIFVLKYDPYSPGPLPNTYSGNIDHFKRIAAGQIDIGTINETFSDERREASKILLRSLLERMQDLVNEDHVLGDVHFKNTAPWRSISET